MVEQEHNIALKLLILMYIACIMEWNFIAKIWGNAQSTKNALRLSKNIKKCTVEID